MASMKIERCLPSSWICWKLKTPGGIPTVSAGLPKLCLPLAATIACGNWESFSIETHPLSLVLDHHSILTTDTILPELDTAEQADHWRLQKHRLWSADKILTHHSPLSLIVRPYAERGWGFLKFFVKLIVSNIFKNNIWGNEFVTFC